MADKKCEHQKEQAEIHLPAKQSNSEGTGKGAGKDTMINPTTLYLDLVQVKTIVQNLFKSIVVTGFCRLLDQTISC